jgi:hypothetical protein
MRRTSRGALFAKIIMRLLALALTLAGIALGQAPANQTDECDPFEEICQGDLDCASLPQNGVSLFSSPTSQTAFQSVNVPINVSWSYQDASDEYPLRNVGLYYRQVGIIPFTKLIDVDAGLQTASVTISNVAPGNYEVGGVFMQNHKTTL